MDYFSFDEQRTLLFVTLTFVTITLITSWVILIELKGLGVWKCLDPRDGTKQAKYRSRFLKPNKIKKHKAVYVSPELYDFMQLNIMYLMNSDLTVGGYIDNILKDHFDQYANEIVGISTGNELKTE